MTFSVAQSQKESPQETIKFSIEYAAMKAPRFPAYEFGPYRLDAVGRSLRCGAEVVALPPKAVDVLAELVKRPGEVVGKDERITTVWRDTCGEEANHDQLVGL